MEYFSVKNFERYQQYKDREPTWIKLHRSLLRDYEFCRLSEEQKGQLMLIWLLMSQQPDRILPADPGWIASQSGMQKKPNLQVFFDAGWLMYQNDTDSYHVDTDSYQNDVTQTETDPSLRERDRDREETDPRQAPDIKLSTEEDSDPLKPEDLVNAWNHQCHPVGLGEVKELSAARRQKLVARIKEHPDPDWWTEVLYKIRSSRFCLGQSPPRNGNGKSWRASFDWMIGNDTNALKALEGKYDG